MNRPNKKDYVVVEWQEHPSYIKALENYCDELEKAFDKACYKLMGFAECNRCPMKDDHCMITNWQCKDKWKEWLLKINRSN